MDNKLKKIAPKEVGFLVSFAPSEFGDYSTNLALAWGKKEGKSPMEEAEEIISSLKKDKKFSKLFSEVKAVAPGFINFRLSEKSWKEGLEEVLKKEEKFGQQSLGKGQKINIEFVSANPTGPLVLPNGRSAAYGESLARIFNFLNFKVTKEYYINDIGRQIRILGESVARRYLELEGQIVDFPEEMYQGAYIAEIAKDFKKDGAYHGSSDDFEELANQAQKYAKEKMIRQVKDSLSRFGVKHDVWFKESSLLKNNELKDVLNFLEFNNLSYEKEGALWFKGSDYGLDNDVVIRKSDGYTTYLLSDFAYARNKEKRGFAKMIIILGADHHGDVPRIKAGIKALGLDLPAQAGESKFVFPIVQMVNLLEKGEAVRMSKRAGKFVLLDELLEKVPADVVKFFFLSKSLDSHIDFDLELAKEESSRNPAYYIQYAFVRLKSILAKAGEGKVKVAKKIDKNISWHKWEEEVIRKLIQFPEVLEKIVKDYQIHQAATYALDLAGLVNRFYEKSKVIGAEPKLERARLSLVKASATVLGKSLELLGLSLPERM
ncbi:MAG: arginine--tRNA ligase [Candidatus Yanofskybacteria bacterium RIFCSPLOWO2_02_FULL_43_10b]|uniref:Arginine--tRNA ligase n=1 Tax=Candidatus Yanofskybacteria bacterium RIFCSPLOWO2_02_FULL_43_10b TaxID=1802704 RepID=A0A1F8H5J7_9BACT|nr:MAG: arginine--tRNA ligase [Candidatus Yanofskybacteria bacterium RIFCSPLOWO2_02_FULL_43_10b]